MCIYCVYKITFYIKIGHFPEKKLDSTTVKNMWLELAPLLLIGIFSVLN